MANYNVMTDHVQLPPFESFRDAGSYYATLAHETTHNAEPRIMPHRPEFPPRDAAGSTGQRGIIRAISARAIRASSAIKSARPP